MIERRVGLERLAVVSLERRTAHQTDLIILMTAQLVKPGGMLKSNEKIEESEDLIEPPILPEVPFYKR